PRSTLFPYTTLFRSLAAQLVDVVAGLVDVAANACAHLDDRGVHLGFDPLLKAEFALLQHLGLYVRAQVASNLIDRLGLLFNAKRKRWPHGASWGQLEGHCKTGTRDWGLGTNLFWSY